MTTTRTETISLSLSIAFFHRRLTRQFEPCEEIRSFQGYVLSSIITLQLQEYFVIVRNSEVVFTVQIAGFRDVSALNKYSGWINLIELFQLVTHY